MDINFDSLIKTNPKLNSNQINASVAQFCKANRVFGGSFAILSKRFKRPFLLFSKDLKDAYNLDPEIDFYQYLNTPYDSIFKTNASDKYFIDFLFYIFRMEGIPEYVKRLNEDNKNPFEFPFQTKLRRENKILHCSTGEILFFLLSWRLVIKKILKDISGDEVLDYFNINSSNLPIENKFHTISKIEIVQNDPDLDIEAAINRNLNAINHLKDDEYLKDLGLTENSIFQQDLKHYLTYIGFESEISNEEAFFIELNRFYKIDLNSPDSVFLLLKEIHSSSRFPILPYYYIYKFDSQNRRKDHFVTPVWWTYSEATRYVSHKDEDEIQEVLHSLYTVDPLINKKEWYTTDRFQASELSKSFKDYLFNFNTFFSNFVNPIIDSEYYSKQRDLDINELKRNSIKSSLAAVMSRNMSHNIGSHVLNKLSSASEIEKFFDLKKERRFVKGFLRPQNLEEFTFPDLSITREELNENTEKDDSKEETPLENLNKKLKENSNYLEQYKFSTFIGEKDIYTLSPYFVDVNNNTTKEELARVFNDYLKKRMDFVADVATSNKALLNSNKYLFADIFRGFERNLLLLQNISGKEDKFSYQFQFQYCDGSINEKGNPKVFNYYHYKKNKENGKLTLDLDDEGVPKKNNDFVDPILAVPNDVLGSQAFYIILENIIRNTAKHSGSGNVVFTIKVEDLKEDDFYRVTVFDDVSFNADKADIEKYKDKIDDFKALKKKEQDNAIKAYKLKKLVVDRNISIAQDVLDENNEIRTAGWGTIEIKLAACYLSGLDMLEMDNKLYWPIGYPAYVKAKQTDTKTVEPTPDGEKIKEKAKEAYIKYLTQSKVLKEENKKFEIPVEGFKGFVTAIDCPDSLKRTVLKKGKDYENNTQRKGITRYPIVQAVDGSADETSGFGYSFLMKKPKKLLILDEENSLQYFDDEKYAELTALKRLGIDIIKTPKSDSIYNHQFMIIVGDKNSRHYGDWFNLPQERFVYDNNSFSLTYLKSYREEVDIEGSKFKFQYSYSKSDGNIISLNHSLPALLNNLDEIHLIYKALYKTFYNNIKLTLFPQIIDYNEDNKLLDELGLTFTHWLDDLVSEDIIDDLEPAKFDHHGSQKQEEFESDNNLYSEIFGSVSPIGLFLEGKRDAIRKLINNDSFNSLDSLKLDTQYFFTKGVNSKVMVIDERIQNSLNDIGAVVEASKNRITGYSLKNDILFKKANILVPQAREQNKNLNLNESSLHSIKENLYQYIRSNSENLEYFVIHFGVLESLRGNSEDTIISILNEVEKSILDNNCKLVITSGRGHTPDIKSMKRYFVAYSTISNLLLDPNSRSKSHLIECLNQLRIKTI